MALLTFLLFILPGFFLEYLYEMCCKKFKKPNNTDIFYRLLRGLFFNVPMTLIVWVAIWIYKTVLGFPMVASIEQFTDWSLSSTFLLHYLLVLLAELLFFLVGCILTLSTITLFRKRKK